MVLIIRIADDAFFTGLFFRFEHGTEIEVPHADHEDHDKSQDSVKVIRNGCYKRRKIAVESAGRLKVAANCGCPA